MYMASSFHSANLFVLKAKPQLKKSPTLLCGEMNTNESTGRNELQFLLVGPDVTDFVGSGTSSIQNLGVITPRCD
ncbi:hypothetical protein AZE41_03665 [Sporosarcina psychrophila]|nr:hypothetical protein AZE41_03665 [Sporosarcina psychrophila]